MVSAVVESLGHRRGELYRAVAGSTSVECTACAHECVIADGEAGVCRVRFNQGGELQVPWGYVFGMFSTPIEKAPFAHVLPGARVTSFSMLGCNMHCAYCHNWGVSQAFKDRKAQGPGIAHDAEDLVRFAVRDKAAAIVSAYNEPLITSEWAAEIFRLAHIAGLRTGFVSNGHGTPEVLRFLRPYLDFLRIDLKDATDEGYRELGARLQPVLDSIDLARRLGIWLELVTCLVPGLNDSDENVERMATMIREFSPDIPWHLTAFHPDYKMKTTLSTSPAALVRAAEIATRVGLRFVYCAHHLVGQVGRWQHTYCPECQRRLIARRGFDVLENQLRDDGRCADCAYTMPGFWRAAA